MKTNELTSRTCPICGQNYTDHPAVSRTDNITMICPDCGTRQALASIGISAEEQEQILQTIHRNKRGNEYV